MIDRSHRSRWASAAAALATAGVFAATIAFPASALAQRGSGDRTGGGHESGRDSGARRDEGSSRRSDSGSRRDSTPSYSPRRDSTPSYSPRHDSTPSYTPRSGGSDSSPYVLRRDGGPSYTQRNDSHGDSSSYWQRHDYTPSYGQRDSSPLLHSGDGAKPAPRRDTYSAPPSSQRDDWYSRRNHGGSDSGTQHGSGDIFNRRGSGQDSASTRSDWYSRRSDHGGSTFEQRGGTLHRDDPAPFRNRSGEIFSRSWEGRRYDNGLYLRPATRIYDNRLARYYPSHFVSYPYYCPTFSFGVTFYSPYSYYYGVCAPYIYRTHCFYGPPATIFIDVPIYVGDECRGYDTRHDDYYLNTDASRYREPGLDSAIDKIRDTFRTGDVQSLVDITDPKVRIAVFQRGKYQYSIDPGDYLDMTRDALQSTETVAFDLYRVHQRGAGVYVVSGKHEYRNHDGETRTVYVSYALERIDGRWLLTQVGTAPDRIEEPK